MVDEAKIESLVKGDIFKRYVLHSADVNHPKKSKVRLFYDVEEKALYWCDKGEENIKIEKHRILLDEIVGINMEKQSETLIHAHHANNDLCFSIHAERTDKHIELNLEALSKSVFDAWIDSLHTVIHSVMNENKGNGTKKAPIDDEDILEQMTKGCFMRCFTMRMKSRVFVAYVPSTDDGVGRLSYKDKENGERFIDLDNVTDLYFGKQTEVFEQRHAQSADAALCFSIMDHEGESLNIQVGTQVLYEVWEQGLKALLQPAGPAEVSEEEEECEILKSVKPKFKSVEGIRDTQIGSDHNSILQIMAQGIECNFYPNKDPLSTEKEGPAALVISLTYESGAFSYVDIDPLDEEVIECGTFTLADLSEVLVGKLSDTMSLPSAKTADNDSVLTLVCGADHYNFDLDFYETRAIWLLGIEFELKNTDKNIWINKVSNFINVEGVESKNTSYLIQAGQRPRKKYPGRLAPTLEEMTQLLVDGREFMIAIAGELYSTNVFYVPDDSYGSFYHCGPNKREMFQDARIHVADIVDVIVGSDLGPGFCDLLDETDRPVSLFFSLTASLDNRFDLIGIRSDINAAWLYALHMIIISKGKTVVQTPMDPEGQKYHVESFNLKNYDVNSTSLCPSLPICAAVLKRGVLFDYYYFANPEERDEESDDDEEDDEEGEEVTQVQVLVFYNEKKQTFFFSTISVEDWENPSYTRTEDIDLSFHVDDITSIVIGKESEELHAWAPTEENPHVINSKLCFSVCTEEHNYSFEADTKVALHAWLHTLYSLMRGLNKNIELKEKNEEDDEEDDVSESEGLREFSFLDNFTGEKLSQSTLAPNFGQTMEFLKDGLKFKHYEVVKGVVTEKKKRIFLYETVEPNDEGVNVVVPELRLVDPKDPHNISFLHLSDIVDIFIGKQTPALDSLSGAKAISAHCFALKGKKQNWEFEATNPLTMIAFLGALMDLLSANDRRVVEISHRVRNRLQINRRFAIVKEHEEEEIEANRLAKEKRLKAIELMRQGEPVVLYRQKSNGEIRSKNVHLYYQEVDFEGYFRWGPLDRSKVKGEVKVVNIHDIETGIVNEELKNAVYEQEVDIYRCISLIVGHGAHTKSVSFEMSSPEVFLTWVSGIRSLLAEAAKEHAKHHVKYHDKPDEALVESGKFFTSWTDSGSQELFVFYDPEDQRIYWCDNIPPVRDSEKSIYVPDLRGVFRADEAEHVFKDCPDTEPKHVFCIAGKNDVNLFLESHHTKSMRKFTATFSHRFDVITGHPLVNCDITTIVGPKPPPPEESSEDEFDRHYENMYYTDGDEKLTVIEGVGALPGLEGLDIEGLDPKFISLPIYQLSDTKEMRYLKDGCSFVRVTQDEEGNINKEQMFVFYARVGARCGLQWNPKSEDRTLDPERFLDFFELLCILDGENDKFWEGENQFEELDLKKCMTFKTEDLVFRLIAPIAEEVFQWLEAFRKFITSEADEDVFENLEGMMVAGAILRKREGKQKQRKNSIFGDKHFTVGEDGLQAGQDLDEWGFDRSAYGPGGDLYHKRGTISEEIPKYARIHIPKIVMDNHTELEGYELPPEQCLENLIKGIVVRSYGTMDNPLVEAVILSYRAHIDGTLGDVYWLSNTVARHADCGDITDFFTGKGCPLFPEEFIPGANSKRVISITGANLELHLEAKNPEITDQILRAFQYVLSQDKDHKMLLVKETRYITPDEELPVPFLENMKRGITFTGCDISRKGKVMVQDIIMILKMDDERGPCLSWCPKLPSKRRFMKIHSIPVKDIIQIAIGKRAKVFQHKHCSDFKDSRCFSIVTNKLQINLVAHSESVAISYLYSVNYLLAMASLQCRWDPIEDSFLQNRVFNTVPMKHRSNVADPGASHTVDQFWSILAVPVPVTYYYMEGNTAVAVETEIVYEQNRGLFGAFVLPVPGLELKHENYIMVDRIEQMKIGKVSRIMQSPIASAAVTDHCMTLTAAGRSYDLFMPDTLSFVPWVVGIQIMLLYSGWRTIYREKIFTDVLKKNPMGHIYMIKSANQEIAENPHPLAASLKKQVSTMMQSVKAISIPIKEDLSNWRINQLLKGVYIYSYNKMEDKPKRREVFLRYDPYYGKMGTFFWCRKTEPQVVFKTRHNQLPVQSISAMAVGRKSQFFKHIFFDDLPKYRFLTVAAKQDALSLMTVNNEDMHVLVYGIRDIMAQNGRNLVLYTDGMRPVRADFETNPPPLSIEPTIDSEIDEGVDIDLGAFSSCREHLPNPVFANYEKACEHMVTKGVRVDMIIFEKKKQEFERHRYFISLTGDSFVMHPDPIWHPNVGTTPYKDSIVRLENILEVWIGKHTPGMKSELAHEDDANQCFSFLATVESATDLAKRASAYPHYEMKEQRQLYYNVICQNAAQLRLFLIGFHHVIRSWKRLEELDIEAREEAVRLAELKVVKEAEERKRKQRLLIKSVDLGKKTLALKQFPPTTRGRNIASTGINVKMYTLDPSQKRLISFFFHSVNFYWVVEGEHLVPRVANAIPPDQITDVYVGKLTPTLKAPIANAADEDFCVSFTCWGGKTFDFECLSRGDRKYIVDCLHMLTEKHGLVEVPTGDGSMHLVKQGSPEEVELKEDADEAKPLPDKKLSLRKRRRKRHTTYKKPVKGVAPDHVAKLAGRPSVPKKSVEAAEEAQVEQLKLLAAKAATKKMDPVMVKGKKHHDKNFGRNLKLRLSNRLQRIQDLLRNSETLTDSENDEDDSSGSENEAEWDGVVRNPSFLPSDPSGALLALIANPDFLEADDARNALWFATAGEDCEFYTKTESGMTIHRTMKLKYVPSEEREPGKLIWNKVTSLETTDDDDEDMELNLADCTHIQLGNKPELLENAIEDSSITIETPEKTIHIEFSTTEFTIAWIVCFFTEFLKQRIEMEEVPIDVDEDGEGKIPDTVEGEFRTVRCSVVNYAPRSNSLLDGMFLTWHCDKGSGKTEFSKIFYRPDIERGMLYWCHYKETEMMEEKSLKIANLTDIFVGREVLNDAIEAECTELKEQIEDIQSKEDHNPDDVKELEAKITEAKKQIIDEDVGDNLILVFKGKMQGKIWFTADEEEDIHDLLDDLDGMCSAEGKSMEEEGSGMQSGAPEEDTFQEAELVGLDYVYDRPEELPRKPRHVMESLSDPNSDLHDVNRSTTLKMMNRGSTFIRYTLDTDGEAEGQKVRLFLGHKRDNRALLYFCDPEVREIEEENQINLCDVVEISLGKSTEELMTGDAAFAKSSKCFSLHFDGHAESFEATQKEDLASWLFGLHEIIRELDLETNMSMKIVKNPRTHLEGEEGEVEQGE